MSVILLSQALTSVGNIFDPIPKIPGADTFLKQKAHTMTEEINTVRRIILDTDERLEETIKWSSPTFIYEGNIASFFMKAKKSVSLMFHEGVLIDDDTGLLRGDGKETRIARFEDAIDIDKKREGLRQLIRKWMKCKTRAKS